MNKSSTEYRVHMIFYLIATQTNENVELDKWSLRTSIYAGCIAWSVADKHHHIITDEPPKSGL